MLKNIHNIYTFEQEESIFNNHVETLKKELQDLISASSENDKNDVKELARNIDYIKENTQTIKNIFKKFNISINDLLEKLLNICGNLSEDQIEEYNTYRIK